MSVDECQCDKFMTILNKFKKDELAEYNKSTVTADDIKGINTEMLLKSLKRVLKSKKLSMNLMW